MKTNSVNDNEINNSSNYKSRNDAAKTFVYTNNNTILTQTEHKPENNLKQKSNIKTKQQDLTTLIKTFATVVSASIIGVAGVGSILPLTSIKAEIHDVYAYETGVSYFITLDEYNGEDDVYVVLYNDFTNRSQKIEDSSIEGTFEQLQTNMTYTLAVKKGSHVIVSTTIKTVNQDKQEYYDDTGQDDPTTGDNTDPTTGDNTDPTTGDNTNQNNDNIAGESTNG